MTASTLSASEYRGEWAQWLTGVFAGVSTSLITLTFAPRAWEFDPLGPLGPTKSRVRRAAHRFERSLIRALARPSFFIVSEVGGWNGRVHLHSLVSSTDRSVIRAAAAGHLKDGFTNEKVCAMSPSDYVSKYVSKSDQDFWLAGGPLFRGTGGVLSGCSELTHSSDGAYDGRYGLDKRTKYVTDSKGRYV